jgi:hypothetical protein
MSSSTDLECCVLQHRGFALLGQVTFCRSPADNVPVVMVPMGEREAAVPLRSLQREWQIADDSADGRMLTLIAAALDFVGSLQTGDPLPREVLTGEASWEPRAVHRQRAILRLRLNLVVWLGRETGDASLAEQSLSPDRIDQDPVLRAKLNEAFTRAARSLQVPNGAAVVTLLERVADEMAYIEALRELLLQRVQRLAAVMERLANSGWRGNANRADSLKQVHRLSAIAMGQFDTRFNEIDAQTGEVISTLRNADSQCAFIRCNRDWLHRTRVAWEPILQSWDMPPSRLDEPAWQLIGKTYTFLAPRFMPMQEWQLANKARRGQASDGLERALQW